MDPHSLLDNSDSIGHLESLGIGNVVGESAGLVEGIDLCEELLMTPGTSTEMVYNRTHSAGDGVTTCKAIILLTVQLFDDVLDIHGRVRLSVHVGNVEPRHIRSADRKQFREHICTISFLVYPIIDIFFGCCRQSLEPRSCCPNAAREREDEDLEGPNPGWQCP